jgi:hypothetical protein
LRDELAEEAVIPSGPLDFEAVGSFILIGLDGVEGHAAQKAGLDRLAKIAR